MHLDILAPTKEILNEYKKNKDWFLYKKRFTELMEQRDISNIVKKEMFNENSCLLCSEHSPEKCHRRLVAEYLKHKWMDEEINIIHL